MKKTFFTTIVMLCLFSWATVTGTNKLQAQSTNLTEIIIGDGTELTCDIPFNACTNGWSGAEIIYPAEAIGGPCLIHSVSFYCGETSTFDGAPSPYQYACFSMYLGTTDKDLYAEDYDFYQGELQLHFDRNWTWTEIGQSTGWITFDLDRPFIYREGNLMVKVYVCSNVYDGEGYSPMKVTYTETANSVLDYNGIRSSIRPNIKLGVAQNISLKSVPCSIDFKERPSGFWTKEEEILLINEGISGEITSITSDNTFFSINCPEIPFSMNELDSLKFTVSAGTGTGSQQGDLTVAYGNEQRITIPASATTYVPIPPDVWELAREISEYPFSETVTANQLHNDYALPGETRDANDAVFKLVFDSDVLLAAEMTGSSNGKLALYSEDFEEKGGPSTDNYLYFAEKPSPYDCNFEDGTFGPFNWDGDTNWEVTSSEAFHGSKCMKSAIESQGNGASTAKITINIPTNANIVFDAKVSSERGFDKGYFYLDEVEKLCISGDGSWSRYSYPVSAGEHTFCWIYQKDASGNSHDDCFYVDDICFCDEGESSQVLIEEAFVSKGTYYLAASSASDEFKINVSIDRAPLPFAPVCMFPANNTNFYGECPSALLVNFGEYASEYQVLLGETNPPTDVCVDWTFNLNGQIPMEPLEDGRTYYWQVNERNETGLTNGPVWAFSTYKGINVSPDNIIYVTPTGSGLKDGSSWENAASDIQVAIDAAASVEEDKPTVWISKGNYYITHSEKEITDDEQFFITSNNINVYGGFNGDESPNYDLLLRDFVNNASIIDMQDKCQGLYVTGKCTWDGCVFQNAKGANVYIGDGQTSLKNCRILNGSQYGLYVNAYWENGSQITDCVIADNTNIGLWGACTLLRCQLLNNGTGATTPYDSGTLYNCLLANNSIGTDFQQIKNSTIVNNEVGIAVEATGNIRDVYISNSIIWGNRTPFDCSDISVLFLNHNAIQGPLNYGIYPTITLAANGEAGVQPNFVQPSEGIGPQYSGGDWSLLPSSPCVNSGYSENLDSILIAADLYGNERIQNGQIDLGAIESSFNNDFLYPIQPDASNIIYVKKDGHGDGSSWENATGNLLEAIETAVLYEPAATIWVAEGEYTPLRENEYYDFYQTVSGGYMLPIKENLKIYGGFVGNEPADYDLRLRDFSNHTSILNGFSQMRVWQQLADLPDESPALVDGFTIRNGVGNRGSGAYILKNTTLSHCRIENCEATEGGGIYSKAATVTCCIIENNTAELGGGLYAIDSKIIQTHIGNNAASEHGGGAFIDNSDILQCNIVRNAGEGLYMNLLDKTKVSHLCNTIIWGNESDNIFYINSLAKSNTKMSHCAVENLTEVEQGNISLSSNNMASSGPCFSAPSLTTGPSNGLSNWQLTENSVCIDAGTNTVSFSTIPEYDLRDTTRIQNGIVDIGGYECLSGACLMTEMREASITQGESFDFYGTVLNEPGRYEHRWSIGECDSLVVLNLHFVDIIYVSAEGAGTKDGSSWENALDGNGWTERGYTKLAETLSAAEPFTQFWLKEGTYMPCTDGDRQKSFVLKEGISIYGGFEGYETSTDERNIENAPTIFTGELQDDEEKTNNTECLFVTHDSNVPWLRKSLLDGITLTHGYASTHQGAVLQISEMAIMELDNCSIVENFEGGIFNEGKLNIKNTNISNNDSQILGEYISWMIYNNGVISNSSKGVAEIDNCTFISNHSEQNGAIFNDGEMRIYASVFDDNTANHFGTILSLGKIKIHSTTFNNNRAENRIGVMYVTDSLELVNCAITNNHSNYYTATHYPEQSASYGGYRTSGIEAYGYSYVKGCSFINNNSNTCLGGAFSVMGSADIQDCVFIGNKGVGPWRDPNDPVNGLMVIVVNGSPDGPALYVEGIARVVNCDFSNNEGYNGNTIGVFTSGNLTMDKCRIAQSACASPLWGGGAIMLFGDMSMTNSIMANNNVYCIQQKEGIHSNIRNSTFTNNADAVFGFYSISDNYNSTWVNMDNCILSGYGELSRVDSIGYSDVIYGIRGVINANNTLLDPSTNGLEERGLMPNIPQMPNVIIVNVTGASPDNSDAAVIDSITALIRSGNFTGTFVRDNLKIECVPTSSQGNTTRGDRTSREFVDGYGNLYDMDPQFVNPTNIWGIDENLNALDADWHLQETSPCINAGVADETDFSPTALDLGNELRVKNCQIDMGAFEFGTVIYDTIHDVCCEGYPYADNGFDLPAMKAGDYVFDQAGDCNENLLRTLILHVNPTTYNTLYEVVQESYELNGEVFTESGTYQQILSNQHGCDSLLTLNLMVNPEPALEDVADVFSINGDHVEIQFVSPHPQETGFRWTNDDPGIGAALHGDGSILSFDVSVLDGHYHEAHFTVTPYITYEGGMYYEGEPKAFAICVLPYEGYAHPVTVTANDNGKGSVSGSGCYPHGSTCTLSAIANEGYSFYYWTDGNKVLSVDPYYSFTVERDWNIEACFVDSETLCEIDFELWSTDDDLWFGEGWHGNKLTIYYENLDCSEQITYDHGSNAIITRNVSPNCHLELGWVAGDRNGYCSFAVSYGNGLLIYSSSGQSYGFHHQIDVDCIEAYIPILIEASSDNSEYGTVDGSGDYIYGDQCLLTAGGNEGYAFMYWTENDTVVSMSPSYSFEVTRERDLVAHFADESELCTVLFNLTSSWNQDLFLTVHDEDYGFTEQIDAPCATRHYKTGDHIIVEVPDWSSYSLEGTSYTITYENGYLIDGQNYLYHLSPRDFYVDCSESLIPINVGAAVTPNEGGAVTGNGDFVFNENCHLTAIPNDGYVFRRWIENGETISVDEELSFAVTEGRNLVAEFVPEDSGCNIAFNLRNNTGSDFWGENRLKLHYDDIDFSEVITLNDYGVSTFHRIVEEGDQVDVNVLWGYWVWPEFAFDVTYENGYPLYPETRLENAAFPLVVAPDCVNETYDLHFISEGNWSNQSNWQFGITPRADYNVFIDANCTLDTDADVDALTITENKTLTLTPSHTLTVRGDLINGNASALVLNDGAQLLSNTPGAFATMKKTVEGFGDSLCWYLIATPMLSTPLSAATTAIQYDLFRYDEPLSYWMQQQDDTEGFEEFTNTKGYLYASQFTNTLHLTGELKPSGEAVTIPLSNESDILPGFNLVGNPFPCNATVDRNYWRLDDDHKTLIEGSGPIKPCEAVFVKANGAGETITFTRAE